MSFEGLLFDSTRKYPSFSMLNIKCLIVGTGDQILAIAPEDLEIGMCASVTADSTGLTLRAGVVYVRTASGWEAINYGTHTHTSNNDGGLLTKAMVKGSRTLWLRNYISPKHFYNSVETSISGGTISYNSAGHYLRLETNTTTNNYANIYDRGLLYTFAAPLMFDARVKLSTVYTSYVTRLGLNAEDANDPTLNYNPKMLIEGCDTCSADIVTVVSADGVNRQKDPTSTSDQVDDVANYRMELDPVLDKIFYSRDNNTFITKTNFIPNSGVPARDRLVCAGVQTKNTTEKIMEIYGFYAYGTIGESSWNPATHSSYESG